MKPKTKVELGDVQKILFMPVWARAVESLKKNSVFTDKTAIDIISSVDYDFDQMSGDVSDISQIAWIARCKRFDSVINNLGVLVYFQEEEV